MIGIMVAGGVALATAVLGTPLLIRWLRRHGIGQQIREVGPPVHVTKAGTPTMGGAIMIGATILGYGSACLVDRSYWVRPGAVGVLAVVGFGLVGFADDLIKVRRQRSLGLNKRLKFGSQVAIAALFAFLALEWAGTSTRLSFTRFDFPGVQLGRVGWSIWAVLIMVGAANAVNLTDGLDGLASGSAAFSFSMLSLVGYWQFRHMSIYHVPSALGLSLLAIALCGACVGFLWWNAAPAKIFMGDTGSLALGAGLAALGLEMNLQLLLPVIGGLFVIVTVSVIIQVISFHLFGRRVFRMAPLHHHFEMKGWPETTVIVRFWIMAAICTAVALGIFYGDFLAVARIK